ncbi:GNAT family N-acetyltransferase [Microbispora sp. NEAU-D428]|uniref:GNAT family N-acetyltransferase n=1 Tax=Microbispora sitophila TaxID=2771537 RepID=UPI0018687149|nr:GNAT family N-acetyltransferase [Microbispora sitophila]MBE3013206.1 GNAT family N-acetyltransferase [Microbispora sitophila]
MTSARFDRRPYAGAEDLRAMQDLAGRLWSPGATWHVGDLAWERFQHAGREHEWRTMLWDAGGTTAAWGWADSGHLGLVADPGHPSLADEVLDWFAATAPATAPRPARTVTVSSTETHLFPALDRHGYRRTGEGPFFVHMVMDLADGLPEPSPPAGYRLRAVGDADVPQRVAAHRAAFHPSRVTEESYRAVRRAWPYRPDLDWVAAAPDGRAAAFCLVWLDEANRAARIEPAGTAPGHRRRGLARAVCLAALHAVRRAGARRAVVSPRGDDAYPVPARLYRSLGFRECARSLGYRRSA